MGVPSTVLRGHFKPHVPPTPHIPCLSTDDPHPPDADLAVHTSSDAALHAAPRPPHTVVSLPCRCASPKPPYLARSVTHSTTHCAHNLQFCTQASPDFTGVSCPRLGIIMRRNRHHARHNFAAVPQSPHGGSRRTPPICDVGFAAVCVTVRCFIGIGPTEQLFLAEVYISHNMTLISVQVTNSEEGQHATPVSNLQHYTQVAESTRALQLPLQPQRTPPGENSSLTQPTSMRHRCRGNQSPDLTQHTQPHHPPHPHPRKQLPPPVPQPPIRAQLH